MFGIGPLELVMILVVALLVFGPKRVPELARTLGRGLAEFRRATNDLRQSLALDELQQDLRRDRLGSQTIHRPGSRPDDRPAQAGDDVDSGAKPAPAASDMAADSEGPATPKRAGEVPFDNDHEHHDEAVDADTNADVDSITEKHSNSPADSELGNLPTSGSNPADPRRG